MTLFFYCNHLAHVIVLCQIKKVCVTAPFCDVLFCIGGQFPSISPRGVYSEERFTDGFLCYEFGRLIFGGAYTCRGLLS